MLWRDVVDLIGETFTENAMGDTISTLTKRQVFANKKSVRQSEFYLAASSGLRPELMFEVRYVEYNNEDILEYNGKQYAIIRQYSKNDEIVELICEGVVNNAITEISN